MNGRFISFEGPDGAGKTTQLSLLSRYLDDRDILHHCTREPGGTPGAEAIRNLIFDSRHNLVPRAELLLFAAARAQHVEERIVPLLEKGIWVLCDRFTLSTLVYQGYGRGLDRELIGQLNAIATCGLAPHMQLVLDVEAEAGQNRIQQRLENNNSFDALSEDFHRRVVAGFREVASHDAHCRLIDGSRNPEQVHGSIVAALREGGLLDG